jgi:hypothetical protein
MPGLGLLAHFGHARAPIGPMFLSRTPSHGPDTLIIPSLALARTLVGFKGIGGSLNALNACNNLLSTRPRLDTVQLAQRPHRDKTPAVDTTHVRCKLHNWIPCRSTNKKASAQKLARSTSILVRFPFSADHNRYLLLATSMTTMNDSICLTTARSVVPLAA